MVIVGWFDMKLHMRLLLEETLEVFSAFYQLVMRIVASNVRKLFYEIMQVYLSYVSVTVLCEHWHTGTQTASLRAATLVSGGLVAT